MIKIHCDQTARTSITQTLLSISVNDNKKLAQIGEFFRYGGLKETIFMRQYGGYNDDVGD